MKKKVLFSTALICALVFVFFKRNDLKKTIESEEMSTYLFFDSYVKQFGYPKDKKQFEGFIGYCKNVVGHDSKIWDNEYYLVNENDSVKVFVKSNYFINDLNILSVKIDDKMK